MTSQVCRLTARHIDDRLAVKVCAIYLNEIQRGLSRTKRYTSSEITAIQGIHIRMYGVWGIISCICFRQINVYKHKTYQ